MSAAELTAKISSAAVGPQSTSSCRKLSGGRPRFATAAFVADDGLADQAGSTQVASTPALHARRSLRECVTHLGPIGSCDASCLFGSMPHDASGSTLDLQEARHIGSPRGSVQQTAAPGPGADLEMRIRKSAFGRPDCRQETDRGYSHRMHHILVPGVRHTR